MDFNSTKAWSPGPGTEFIESIFGDIDSLDNTGGIHPILFGKFRKLAARFPYSIYDTLVGDMVSVYAVLDDRVDPERTMQRINK